MRKNRTKRRTRRRRRMRGGFMGLNFSMPALPSWLGGSDDKKKDPMTAAAAPVAVPVDEPAGPAGPESTAPAAEPSQEYPSKMGVRRR